MLLSDIIGMLDRCRWIDKVSIPFHGGKVTVYFEVNGIVHPTPMSIPCLHVVDASSVDVLEAADDRYKFQAAK